MSFSHAFFSCVYVYFTVDTVNPTKCGCPFALKMAACQLLLEITTFLRETFPCLPCPRTEPLVVSTHALSAGNRQTYTKLQTKTVQSEKNYYNPDSKKVGTLQVKMSNVKKIYKKAIIIKTNKQHICFTIVQVQHIVEKKKRCYILQSLQSLH